MTEPRPRFSADVAVAHAHAMIGTGVYELGTGDVDTPIGSPSDCAGFAICQCYGIRRHRPGFNHGSWSSVADDVNSNSAIEDADHAQDLFERVYMPAPGVLLAYPTIHLRAHPTPWIGHVVIVTSVARCAEWDPARPDWSLLDIVECRGPNGRQPGIVAGTAAHFNEHDRMWPKPEHRTAMLRVLP